MDQGDGIDLDRDFACDLAVEGRKASLERNVDSLLRGDSVLHIISCRGSRYPLSSSDRPPDEENDSTVLGGTIARRLVLQPP
jgi:hypothetical protein